MLRPPDAASAALAKRKTYGYKTRVKTVIAPAMERTSGNQASTPKVSRHQPAIGPVKPTTDKVTKPRTYDGIASGAMSSHENSREPGKR